MNTVPGGRRRFRWGVRILERSLGRSIPGAPLVLNRVFRRAPVLGPVLAWIAGMAVHDLRQPDSRIKALVRRLMDLRQGPGSAKVTVVSPASIQGPDEGHARIIGPGNGKALEGKGGSR